MRDFAELYAALDARTSTSAKVAAMVAYLRAADPRDAAWAVALLAGQRPRRAVGSRALRGFALTATGLPEWLFEESYQAVGDLAETIALLLPPPTGTHERSLADWIEQRLLPLREQTPEQQTTALCADMAVLSGAERFLLIKLIGGGFRVGVSRQLVVRALAAAGGLDPRLVAQRWVAAPAGRGEVQPTPAWLATLLAPACAPADKLSGGAPYPFFLAHALAAEPASLGAAGDWLAEWKYDGIRAQLVRRDAGSWLWSRGEELITDRFPEIADAARLLPDGTVLDGEVLVWDAAAAHPGSFARLQTRITRRRVTAAVLREHPAVFVAYDLLERDGSDQRGEPQQVRRRGLEAALAPVAGPVLRLAPLLGATTWPARAAQRADSRVRGVEGLMLKHRLARYGVGRTRDGGVWWKWKIDPYAVDAVLVYAQAGHGRRASLYTDYTFAVWDRAPPDAAAAQRSVAAIAAGEPLGALAARGLPVLVPFAKAYSGLDDAEIRAVDAVIRRTTIEKFGPVRTVVPSLVFTLGFDGIQPSARHKSGLAVRFPRLLRWRTDKPLHEADTLDTLRALLAVGPAGPANIG